MTAGRRLLFVPCLLVLLGLVGSATARAQSADNVLLIVNDADPASTRIAGAYSSRRGLPADHVVHLNIAAAKDSIDRHGYMRDIEAPVAAFLTGHRLQDRILFIVLTKGVPLRVNGTGGLQGTTASVDSELTLLYRKLLGIGIQEEGRIANPYFLGDKPVADARPFTRLSSDIYLVTRLDGFSVDDVLGLIDRGSAPGRDGTIVLDEKATLIDRGGDQWLQEAAARLTAAGAGDRVQLESTRAVATATGPVLGYYSWGSNDPANHQRRSGMPFAPGAIGGTFVSTDGRTFTEPPATWMPSGPDGGPTFAGSFQSLAGNLIRDGITGVSAHVGEPYLDATIRPQILLPAYLAGFNLAESFYLAMPFLSWQTVIVGDPLCAPFRSQVLAAEQLFKDVDPETELPAIFADRAINLLTRRGLNRDAVKALVTADGRTARGVTDGVESLLIRAATLEPRLAMRLAAFYDAHDDVANAIVQYRRVIEVEPENTLALNNLAFSLAERQHAPQEGLPYAERAVKLSADPSVIDTLGWIQHLLGDDRAAAPLIERAAAGAPGTAEILLHAAVVHSALGDQIRAKRDLDAAVQADPKIADRPEAKAVRAKAGGGPGRLRPRQKSAFG